MLPLAAAVFSIDLRDDQNNVTLENLRHQLVLLDFAITGLLDELQSDVRHIAGDPVVRTLDDFVFTSYLDAGGVGARQETGEAELLIVGAFARYRKAHPQVVSVYMGRANGSYISSPGPNPDGLFDPRMQSWYKLAMAGAGRVSRTAPSQSSSTPGMSISAVTALVDGEGTGYGVVGIEVSLAGLTRYVESIRIGDQGYLVLTDSELRVLANPNEFGAVQPGADLSRANLVGVGGSNEGVVSVSGFSLQGKREQQNLYYYRSPDSGWLLAAVLPQSELLAWTASALRRLLVLLGLSLTLLTALSLMRIQKSVIRPPEVPAMEPTRGAPIPNRTREQEKAAPAEPGPKAGSPVAESPAAGTPAAGSTATGRTRSSMREAGEGSQVGTTAVLSECLIELEHHIENRQPERCATVADRIAGYTWPERLAGDIEELRACVRRYWFTEAHAMLKAMRQRIEPEGDGDG